MTHETSNKGSPANQADRIAAVQELRGYDHGFLPKHIVDRLTEPFGLVCETAVEYADPPGTFKGLTLPKGMTCMDGRDAHEVAAEICNHLGVDYDLEFGRGAALRGYCDALLAHLADRGATGTVVPFPGKGAA
jgi:hypothetical protein